MCVTMGEAKLSETKLYAGEARRRGTYVHVVAYQNNAMTTGPNAMVLPLPAAVMPGPQNVVDTRGFRRFLEDIHRATEIVCRGVSETATLAAVAQVFDVGSYTVVLAESPRAVSGALASVPSNKRPALNEAVIAAFDDLYPGWPLALCCWDGSLEAEPLLWWYEPRFPDRLFAPALDAHDGGPPDVGAQVEVDHLVAFGSTLHPMGEEVMYRDDDPPIDDRPRVPSWLAAYEKPQPRPAASHVPPVATTGLLPPKVRGTRLHGRMINGDFWISTRALGGSAERRAPGAARGVEVRLDGWTA